MPGFLFPSTDFRLHSLQPAQQKPRMTKDSVLQRGKGMFGCGHKTAEQRYFRGRVLDQYSVNAASSVFRNHSPTSLAWTERSPGSRSRLSNSVISPAVLGFLILFNARKMCSLRRRLEFGIFFIAGSTVSKN
jgi:hypothetical protein